MSYIRFKRKISNYPTNRNTNTLFSGFYFSIRALLRLSVCQVLWHSCWMFFLKVLKDSTRLIGLIKLITCHQTKMWLKQIFQGIMRSSLFVCLYCRGPIIGLGLVFRLPMVTARSSWVPERNFTFLDVHVYRFHRRRRCLSNQSDLKLLAS